MNQFKNEIISAAVIILSILSFPLKAENINSLLSGYTVTAGASVKELSFDYSRSQDDSEPVGIMTEGMYVTYFFRTGTPYTFSENKKWGYYYEAGFSRFSMTKQNVNLEEMDLGTSVSGNYWYVTPIGFYLFGPVPQGKNEFSLLTGIGIGAGYINAMGNMLLTEDGSNELLAVDLKGIDLAVSILLEAHYGKWMSRIYGGGPYLDSGQSTYSIFDFSWDFGYTHTF